MISIKSIQLSNKASFADKESLPDEVKIESAHVEGQWYGEGSMGITFTEALTQTELNLLTELLSTVAARVAKVKADENEKAVIV